MLNRRIWFLLLLSFAAVTAGTEAHSQTPGLPTIVRTDGVYQAASDKPDSYSFLRFYKDGSVAQCTSTGKPEEVARWLSKTHPYSSQGVASSDGKKIGFVTKSKSAVVDFEGTVEKDGMSLTSYSHATKFRGNYKYRFVPASFPAAN